MSSSNWYKVDNVAKVFLASIKKRDTRTLRVSCTMEEDIDPEVLQEALNETIQIRPQFQVRIRRGIFWHYMEETELAPVVVEEEGRVCPLLYVPGKIMLHYRVSYYHNRINLDLFHAISDGNGALEFLNVLVLEYLKLKHSEEFAEVAVHSGASADNLTEDSYRRYYGGMGLKTSTLKKAYHPGGLRLPYNQLQFFELHMPTANILAKSRTIGVSLTSLLGAMLMIAIRDDMPTRKRKLPITISMPVDLRKFYPSLTSRNFFNNVNVSHIFDEDITLEELAREFDEKLKSCLAPENIKSQMDSFETIENVAPIRAVPLIIKQWVVRFANRQKDKKVTAVLSNLGVRKPPEEISGYISNYSAFCSSDNLFIVMSSYKDRLTLGISSPYVSTGILKDLVREFSSEDIDVVLYATEVVHG